MSDVLLRVDNLTRHFDLPGGGLLKALQSVSFELKRGEVLGVVGESGSGKSTLGKTLLGLHDKTSGSVWLDGRYLPNRYRRSDFRRYSRQLQMVFQDPYGTLNPRLTVGESLAEPLRLQGRGKESRERVGYWLQRVGLAAEAAGRFPHEFSGGQRQRIGIARALIAEPGLVVCDEPVSALDVSVQAQVVNLLAELRRELGLAMLFIAHDLALVRYLCDRVLVMYHGRVVEEGSVAAVFDAPRHPYTQLLLSASPSADPAQRNLPPLQPSQSHNGSSLGCAFAPRCPRAAETCWRNEPPLSGDGQRYACFFPLGDKD